MANCITSTSYTMKADIYQAVITQDSTGAVLKAWEFEKTINCFASGIVVKGIGDNSTNVSITGYLNTLNSMIKLKSQFIIPSDRRVVNVRNKSGVIYLENQDPATEGGFENSTIFEPRGSTALINFDGSVIEYETVLMRQEIQRLS